MNKNFESAGGNIIGARIVSREMGLVIGIIGFALGLLIEGHLLKDSIGKIMPSSPVFIIFALSVSLFIFIFATFARIPLSLTMALVGTGIGISLRQGYAFNQPYVYLVVVAWVFAPLISIGLSIILNKALLRKSSRNPWTVPKQSQ